MINRCQRKLKHPKAVLVLVVAILFTLVVMVFADEFGSSDDFQIVLSAGDAFAVQDSAIDATVSFTVSSGSLTAIASLTVDDDGGSLEVSPSTSGVLTITSDTAYIWIKVNDVTYSSLYTFSAGNDFEVTWTWEAAPYVPEPEVYVLGGDVSLLLVYLQSGDFLGFIAACYTTKIGQLFYALLALGLTVPLALRTQSITYVAIVWLVLAGVFQAAVPLISPASVLLTILAISSLVYKLFTRD